MICFDRLAADARWQSFTADEWRKVDAFLRAWRIAPGDRILEPGCGSGRLTEWLAAATGPTGHVMAFDASPVFIHLARMRSLPACVALQRARVETLRFPTASFDHVVCFNSFPHFVPLERSMQRLFMALHPGGRLWIAHTSPRAAVNRIHRRGPPAIRGHLLPGKRALTRLLRMAGFVEMTIEDGAGRFLASAMRPLETRAGTAAS